MKALHLKMLCLLLALTFSINSSSAENPTLNESLKQHIKYQPDKVNTIGVIRIDDKKSGINQSTWIYVNKALEYYKEKKPAFIILELNTPGGEVYSAQKISDALKQMDIQNKIPVVAFINNWAISAGAMLAYSCRYITTVKDGSMGAAEPVMKGKEGTLESAPEKINSALRADFANRAGFFDRNEDIAEAMVDKDIILVYRDAKIIRLNSEDDIVKTGNSKDEVITSKGKLLTLSALEMIKFNVADILLPPVQLVELTPVEKESGTWPASKMLLFQQPFFKDIPTAVIDEYKMDWKTQMFVWLAHPVVSSLLFLGMMIGFYIEVNSPGFGFAGSLAMVCLFMIALSSFALDIGNLLELVLILAGISFIMLDVFLIPTFGILGFAGAFLLLIGLFGIMLPGIDAVDFDFDTNTFNAAGEVFLSKLAWLSATFVIGLVIIAFLGRYVMPSFSGFKRFVLSAPVQEASEGYVAGPTELPKQGHKGVVIATLRPTGKVEIDDEIYDAITIGDFIERGSQIYVKEISGNVIIVDKQSAQN